MEKKKDVGKEQPQDSAEPKQKEKHTEQNDAKKSALEDEQIRLFCFVGKIGC